MRVIHALATGLRLSRVPDASHTREIASKLSEDLPEPLAAWSPSSVCAALGWRYGVKPIGGPNSTVQSILAPLLVGGFSVVVNAHHPRSDLEALWLTLHEVGHSFFYTAGKPPRRIIQCTLEEERFCDLLADEVLADEALADLPVRNGLLVA